MAAAAWVQAICTAVLVGITWWYAKKTNELAGIARQQLKVTTAAALTAQEQDALALRELAVRLLGQLRALPLEPGAQGALPALYGAAVWAGEDLSLLESLAARTHPTAAAESRTVVHHLAWVGQTLQHVKGEDPGSGFRYNRVDWPRWKQGLVESTSALERIAQVAEVQERTHHLSRTGEVRST